MNKRMFLIASLFFLILLVAFQAFSLNMGLTGIMYTNQTNFSDWQAIYDNASPEAQAPAASPTPAAIVRTVPDGAYLLVGQAGDAAYDSIAWMLECMEILVYTVPELADVWVKRDFEGIILSTGDITKYGDVQALLDYVRAGGQVIFAQLPTPWNETTSAFMAELGILAVGSNVTYEQCEFYAGLLLGGMIRYEEMPVTGQHLSLASTCKVWASMWEGDPDDREDEVPLIYEKRLEQGVVAVVNAPFLTQMDGIGILGSLMALGKEAFITPVVNASTLSVLNFPYVHGNADQLMAAYARDAIKTNRDVIWPDLAHLLRGDRLGVTAYLPDGWISADSDQEMLMSFLIRSLNEVQGELGVMDTMSYRDQMRAVYSNYDLVVGYNTQGDPDIYVHAVALKDEPKSLTLNEDGVIRYPILTEGYEYTEAINFTMRNYASALFMIHHAVDLSLPIRLEQPEHEWQLLNKPLAGMMTAMTNRIKGIEGLSVSDASQNLLRYTLCKPTYTIQADGIVIDSGIEEVTYHLVRTRNGVKGTASAGIEALEDNIYLLTLHGRQGKVLWEEANAP